jgi:hypothetical protein
MSGKTAREQRKEQEEAEARADQTVLGEVGVRVYASGRSELIASDPTMTATEVMNLLVMGQALCVKAVDEQVADATRKKVERSGLVVPSRPRIVVPHVLGPKASQ